MPSGVRLDPDKRLNSWLAERIAGEDDLASREYLSELETQIELLAFQRESAAAVFATVEESARLAFEQRQALGGEWHRELQTGSSLKAALSELIRQEPTAEMEAWGSRVKRAQGQLERWQHQRRRVEEQLAASDEAARIAEERVHRAELAMREAESRLVAG